MTNIGTTRSSVAYLIEVLPRITEDLDEQPAQLGPLGQAARNRRVASLTGNPPPLPNFTKFADRFRHDAKTPDDNLRDAYFLAYVAGTCTFPPTSWPLGSRRDAKLCRRCSSRRTTGLPDPRPRQVVTSDILDFMSALDTREMHGYLPEFGYRVFTEEVLRDSGHD
jgi:arginine decarboxylase